MIPKKSAVPDTLVEQLSVTLSKTEEVKIEEPKKRDRSSQINLILPEDVKTDWKILADKNHINMKQLITFAMEHLNQELSEGEVILTIGGVMKKRK